MFIFGILLAILGAGSVAYGLIQNNSLEAQLTSFFSEGSTNPGTLFIVVGALAVLIGVVLMLRSRRKSP